MKHLILDHTTTAITTTAATGTAARVSGLGAVGALVPSVGSAPPGLGQLATVVSWVTWGVGLALFVGFLVALGKAGLGALRHGHYEGSMAATVCLVCACVLGAAGTIFSVFGVTTT